MYFILIRCLKHAKRRLEHEQRIGRKSVYQVDNYGNAGPLSRRLSAQTLQIDLRRAARGLLSFPAFHLSHRFLGNVLI